MLKKKLVSYFRRITGDEYVLTDHDKLYPYGRDKTMDLHFSFDALIKPGSPEEISEILRICNRYKIPITPRGGGSGVSGGALPIKRGIVLSLERMSRIVGLNKEDGYVIAESGVVNADLCKWVEGRGCYFPVAPASSSYSFIGGNVAENSGSINSCKYGKTGQYVLNLEVVLPTGEITWTGANVSKNSTGINLTQLFVGSEGTLGVITKIVYKLLPAPGKRKLLLARFRKLEDACNAVCKIRQSAILPSTTEMICRNTLARIGHDRNLDARWSADGIDALLLVEVQNTSEFVLKENTDDLLGIISDYTDEEVDIANSEEEQEKLFAIRSSIGILLAEGGSVYRDIDMCIPLRNLYDYILQVENICNKYNIPCACFGHALDGNLHVMVFCESYTRLEADINYKNGVRELYQCGIKLGGVISGEHGIGILQKEFIPMQFSPEQISLMRRIKSLFDPNNILNPGKII